MIYLINLMYNRGKLYTKGGYCLFFYFLLCVTYMEKYNFKLVNYYY